MAEWAKQWQSVLRRLAAIALAGCVGWSGCGKDPIPSQQGGTKPDETASAVAKDAAVDSKEAALSAPLPQDGKHEAFGKATRGGDDPPPNSNPPPDVTVSGKPAYKIYKDVLAMWDNIRFVAPDGKLLHYTAEVETDFGTIEIDLRDDLAPNHVRNFVALARAGYYDDLLVDRICHEEEEIEPGKMQVFDSIEAGCPLGTGDPGNGSIGYWLKPEFPPAEAKATHETGTVGACHGIEADTAACRFYVTLSDAPFLDGNFTIFGKVTRGLDVARTIAKQRTREYEADVAGSLRPDKPIKIKKVSIHVTMREAGR